jgi:hypothetical protein
MNSVLAWHPSRSGDYYERAPGSISDTLTGITVPGQFELDGTVIAKLELLAAERASTEQAARLNTDLESTVSTLNKIMEIHRQLNEIVVNAGEAGIAQTLHQLTGFPVLIQDMHGNTRASAGYGRPGLTGGSVLSRG